ncbi:MAG: UDP-N-acetylmuramate--L-alanine ligase [Lachnospiraceae bacterium]|nr:UDP-N-acetylmuramate--L-alanine ligase [Lachnospiraceae bacterium]
MYQVDFDKPFHAHFTGIGGISMSSLAEILLSKGFSVSGSDIRESAITEHLRALGAQIHIGHCAECIPANTALLVYTAAVHMSNPELAYAASHGIAMLTRAELLGQIMKNYKTAIGVSGTHGKTTTTSMISEVLLKADTDPTILVGGIFPTIGGNTRIGSSGMFITESCEYTNSFLSFCPNLAVILNVRADHLDFFKDIDDIRNSFRRFAELVPEDGTVVINSDIDNVEFFTEGLSCQVITYGTDPATSRYYAANVTWDAYAHGSYDLMDGDTCLGRVSLSVSGEHNVSNSLAAMAACLACGIDFDTAAAGIHAYVGTERRFQRKGCFAPIGMGSLPSGEVSATEHALKSTSPVREGSNCLQATDSDEPDAQAGDGIAVSGVQVIDDYAHHPDEIRATLSTAKKCGFGKIWCVFQPHTYSRTKALLPEFADSLSLADHVILADIYAAREKNTFGISSLDLKAEIEKTGTSCDYFPDFASIEEFARKSCSQGDLLITMGAGDVVNVGNELIQNWGLSVKNE